METTMQFILGRVRRLRSQPTTANAPKYCYTCHLHHEGPCPWAAA
ncbi:hypothetical protein [Streptomyces albidoflavus]|nr:hypothetical protein [Streptomyces albidoflavus]